MATDFTGSDDRCDASRRMETHGSRPLYWSRRGEVACDLHAPASDSSRWKDERWAEMPPNARQRHGVEYQCQYCSASGRPIAHRRLGGLERGQS